MYGFLFRKLYGLYGFFSKIVRIVRISSENVRIFQKSLGNPGLLKKRGLTVVFFLLCIKFQIFKDFIVFLRSLVLGINQLIKVSK